MVVASTFAMADVDGTNLFYWNWVIWRRRSSCSGNNNQVCKFSHDCDRNPESTTQTVPVAPQPSAQKSDLRRAFSFPLNGERSMAQSSRRFSGCTCQARISGLSLHFCCLCVRHHLKVLLIDSVCMSCARQLHFGCSCCKIA